MSCNTPVIRPETKDSTDLPQEIFLSRATYDEFDWIAKQRGTDIFDVITDGLGLLKVLHDSRKDDARGVIGNPRTGRVVKALDDADESEEPIHLSPNADDVSPPIVRCQMRIDEGVAGNISALKMTDNNSDLADLIRSGLEIYRRLHNAELQGHCGYIASPEGGGARIISKLILPDRLLMPARVPFFQDMTERLQRFHF